MINRNPIAAIFHDLFTHGLELFGRYYSTYRGYVVSNADPLNLQRLQLMVPEVGSVQAMKTWAHARNVWSGTNHGVQLIPQVGEMVWVEFERGHPERPIWSHGHFGNGEAPSDDSDLKDPNCYWLITPGGMRVKLNDTKKSLTITANGATIVINQTGQFTISNNETDLKTVLEDILQTYMQTQTITGDMLGPTSLQDVINNLEEVNKLFL